MSVQRESRIVGTALDDVLGGDHAAAPVEHLNRIVCAAMALVFVVAGDRISRSGWFTIWFAGLVALTAVAPHVTRGWRSAQLVRLLLSGVVLLSVYEALGRVIAAIGPPLRDTWVLGLERVVTGGRLPPLTALPLTPGIVDLLSVAYVLYFALPIVLVVTLARRVGERAANTAVFTLLVAFYLHYLLYVLVPVVGPIRTTELPASVRLQLVTAGGQVAHAIRLAISTLEGTPQDAFPSAHTSIAILGAAIARCYRLSLRKGFYLVAVAIVASTVLLGYHYVVDVLAAVPVAWLAWGIARRCRAQPYCGRTNGFVSKSARPCA